MARKQNPLRALTHYIKKLDRPHDHGLSENDSAQIIFVENVVKEARVIEL